MTPKVLGVISGRRDLQYDPKGHGDLCGQFDLVYDPKRSRGHFEVNLTYFVTQKVNLTFDLDLDLKVKAFDQAGDHTCPGNTMMR